MSRSRPPLFPGSVREERPANHRGHVGPGESSWDRNRTAWQCRPRRRARVWPPRRPHSGGGPSPATSRTWLSGHIRLQVNKARSLIHEKSGGYGQPVANHRDTNPQREREVISPGLLKYFVSNDLAASLKTVLRVAFRRATIEHRFRLGQQEVGLMHFEGQQFVALQRHLILSLIVLGFVALHTERLREKKSGDHARASLRRVEPTLCRVTLPSSRPVPATTNPLRAPLPTAA